MLGATTNSGRYAYMAAERLLEYGHEIVPVGIKNGEVFGHKILHKEDPVPGNIDTITMYIGPQHQREWYDYILDLKPRRIIFNPGTENHELIDLAKEQGARCFGACTLVMLSIGKY